MSGGESQRCSVGARAGKARAAARARPRCALSRRAPAHPACAMPCPGHSCGQISATPRHRPPAASLGCGCRCGCGCSAHPWVPRPLHRLHGALEVDQREAPFRVKHAVLPLREERKDTQESITHSLQDKRRRNDGGEGETGGGLLLSSRLDVPVHHPDFVVDEREGLEELTGVGLRAGGAEVVRTEGGEHS